VRSIQPLHHSRIKFAGRSGNSVKRVLSHTNSIKLGGRLGRHTRDVHPEHFNSCKLDGRSGIRINDGHQEKFNIVIPSNKGSFLQMIHILILNEYQREIDISFQALFSPSP
jgi:hypothetical protein